MVTTDALIGARIPDQSDGPLGGLQIGNVVRDLIAYTVPPFSNASARNAAYAAWVAAGGTMRDGLMCTVAGVPQVYRASTWHGMFSIPYRDVTVLSTPQTASADILSIAIPDPNFPYQVHMSGAALVSVDSGVTVDPQLRLNGATVLQGPNMVAGASKLAAVPAAMSDVTTGPSTVAFRIFKSSGAAGSGYTATGTPNVYTQLFAQVVPA